MQTRLVALVVALGSVIALPASNAVAETRSPATVLVEVRSGGDDGLTNQFTEILTAAFQKSAAFRISRSRNAPKLIVSMPTSVWHSGLGNEIEVKAIVNFASSSSEPVGTTIVTCFEGTLDVCANQAVDYAKTLHAY